jgi:hypothetical protein
MNTRLTALALGLVTLAMTGCGSSSSGTTSTSTTASQTGASHIPTTLDASVEAICARRDSTITSAGTEYTTEKELKHMAQGRAAVERTTLTELKKLKAPATIEPGWRQFVTDRQGVIGEWTIIYKHGLTGANNILVSTSAAQEKMLAAAKSLGFKQCTQAD